MLQKRMIKLSIFPLASMMFLAIASATLSLAQGNVNYVQGRQTANDRPLKVTKRPRPRGGLCKDVYAGKTVALVTFDRSGKVTKVVLAVKSGCKKFDEESVDAAKGIEFEPAVKNGEPITVVKKMEYAFRNP